MNSETNNEDPQVELVEEAAKRPTIKVRRAVAAPLPPPVSATPTPEAQPSESATPASVKPKATVAGAKAAGAHRPAPAMPIKPRSKPAPIPAQAVPQRPKPQPTAQAKPTPPGLTMPSTALERDASAPVHASVASVEVSSEPSDATISPDVNTVTAVKSKYYQDVVVDPVSGTHYDLITNKATAELNPEKRRARAQDDDEDEGPTEWDYPKRVRWFLFIYASVLVMTGAAAFFNQKPYWIALFISNLVMGVILPVSKVVPWQDEDPDDVGWLFVGTLAVGPVVAFCVYGVWSLMRRATNYAIVGCLAVSACTRIVVELSTGNPTMRWIFVPWSGNYGEVPIAQVFYVSWAGLFTMLGWYLGNIFHKLDE